MEQFPHLNFIQKVTGKPRLFGGGETSERTKYNKANRQEHRGYLSRNISSLKDDWVNLVSERENNELAKFDKDIVPLFLQLNTDLFNKEFDLQSLGIEIISEEDDGFIIGASLDGFRSLEEKINEFVNKKYGSGIIADLWQIISGNREEWKPKLILSEELLSKWDDIVEERMYNIEVSIAFDKPLGKEPDANKQGGDTRLEKYRQLQIEREGRLMNRENSIDEFINNYGQRKSDFVHLEDSFACEIEISGIGLKDLVFNYPFVFDVSEIEEIDGEEGGLSEEVDFEFDILPPEQNATEVGVIDSGIMENNKYIETAINDIKSKSYLVDDISKADYVEGGGHGTKVAGAILYPKGITGLTYPYQLPCFIRNLRVLDSQNQLINNFPAKLMQTIVEENSDCTVFNLSVNSKKSFRKKHMSSWAATLDSLIHKENKIFIISVGNIRREVIREYLNRGENYPKYLQNPYCRIANPAQSSFALAVGSINHTDFNDINWNSLGTTGNISAFSRIGLGIWGGIKPEVVEFGGGLIVSKNATNSIRENKETSPELIRSTMHGGSAYGKDAVGTSFATPKVTHIVAQLRKLYPEENINLFRALVVQGARLPNEYFQNPTFESIQHFGYGFPSIDRVTKNSDQRITFYNSGTLKTDEGHIYSLKVPEDLRNQGNEYEILIEVTLAFTAKVRRTRQKTKSYLSTWLDWSNSKIDESFDSFKEYILKEIENRETAYDKEFRKGLSDFDWKIGAKSNRGDVDEINRNNSSLQKDWVILKSFMLPNDLNFAVRAHKGWDKSCEEVPYAFTVSIEILDANIPIYESIRIENEIEIPVN